MSSRRRARWRVAPLVGVSLLANFLFWSGIVSSWLEESGPLEAAAANNAPLDVALIEPTVLNPYVAPLSPAEQQAEAEKKQEEAKKPEENPDEHGQVVDTNRPPVEIRPDHAKYLGEFDSKVEHETKGKVGKDKPGSGQQKVASISRPQPAVPSVPEVAPRPPTSHGDPGKLAMRSIAPQRPDLPLGREDGIERTGPEGTEAPRGAPPQLERRERGESGVTQPGQVGQKGRKGLEGVDVPPNLNLQPTREMLASATSGTGSPDYLKDVDDGEETLLNTKRWKYWSFFSRVKRGVAQSWRPERAYGLRDPTGQIYGNKNRFTVLRVSLRPDGSLFADPIVEKPCGVDFLDDEAVSAFKQAQPFPNPPPGLVDPGSKLITFRFGFYFEVGGGPVFKVYRQ